MRKLVTADIPVAADIIKRTGAKDRILQTIKRLDSLGSEIDKLTMGFETYYAIFEVVTEANAFREFYSFLAGPFECSAEEVEQMPFPDLMDRMEQLVRENDLRRFFGLVRRLIR